jgi:pyruvate formate lyase activating enzyme
MNKREFLKTALLGTGAACLAPNLSAFARNFAMPQVGEKWTREAQFYTATPKGVRCQICPNECIVKEAIRAMLNRVTWWKALHH